MNLLIRQICANIVNELNPLCQMSGVLGDPRSGCNTCQIYCINSTVITTYVNYDFVLFNGVKTTETSFG